METLEFYEIQPGVLASLVRMYDRYMEVCIAAPLKKECKTMSFVDFINAIVVRGMIDYDKQLTELENKK